MLIYNAEAELAEGFAGRRRVVGSRFGVADGRHGDEGSGDDAVPTSWSWGSLRGMFGSPIFSNFLLFLAGCG